MPLVTAPMWEVLQWSGCVLATASLFPAVLLLCTCFAKRKPTPSSAGLELRAHTQLSSAPAAAELKIIRWSPDAQSQNPAEVQQTPRGSERLGDMSVRELPRLPLQDRMQVRRHSSYTGSSVYDVVSEPRCPWPEADSRKTCSHLYEEPFPVYAQVHKTTPAAIRDRDNTDFHLYAKVKKTAGRAIKSELIL
ncbi:hypothetical protein SKAU_G00330870 [Synaphobranchus kaupii]|uniref:Uncharacterized protein n=1 Tax=Synaphobranchus kaupii TaxID=118154 RepID=A0A9Q1EL02_SYNKA|nr:hypothetical protein SKAU_G00330870 [Synaphobranchus kaupii]